MDMGTQGSGRKRLPNRERLTAEDDALNQIAREAEARLAAKRAARAEAREIRMKELERQQKEIYQVQKKYYGLDTKWGDIEQWMEDSERYSRRFRRNASASDEDERLSVGSRGSLRVQPELEYGSPYAWTNGYDGDYCGSQSLSRRSGRNSSYSGGDGRVSSLSSSREEKLGLFGSDLGLPSSGLASKPLPTQNGPRPFVLCNAARPAGSYWASMLDESSLYGARRGSTSGSRAPSEYGGHLNSSSRASSRASSARASPVVEERPDKDFAEKGSRNMPSLSAATLASLGGTSSRRGSGDTSISMDTEASIREIKELNELKDQIQDVEGKYMQGLKEMKDSLAEVEEKYKKAMVSNAQLDNEKTNFMYQVDTLKDMLLELEEQLAESQRQYEEKNKEFEREKHAHSILQFQFAEVKEALRQREEMLEKHGIILNSEIATNGETSDTVNDVGYQAPTKITKEELNALKAAGEGTLGKAKEVEVKKEIVEKVGQRETLQDSEQEQPKLNTGKDCVDRGVLHPGEKAENQRPVEDSALSPGPLAGAKCEQEVQSQDQENTSILKSPEQIESHEVTNKSDSRDSNSPEPSSCRGGLDSEVSGPTALGIKNQSENSMDSQGKENQEDLGKGSFEPRPDHVLGQTPEIDKVSCTDSRGTGGNHLEDVVQAGDTIVEDQVGTMASAEQSKSMENHIGRSLNDGLGQSSERELAHEAAELEEALTQSSQAGGENTVTEAEDAAVRDEKPLQADVQATPAAPTVQSGHQDTTGPGSTDTKHTSPHAKERNKAKSEQQAEALDSPQKKTKNKKKKNKKKKAAAPMETCKDANEESSCQDPDVGDGEEEERVQATDKKWAAETPELKEDPQSRPSGKQNDAEEDSGPAEGPTDVLDQNSLQCADGDISPVGRKGPQRDASQIGGEEGLVPSQHPGQADEKGIEGHSVDNSDLSGELGGFNSESGEQAREEVGNSKSKEDCTMS
ncbi:leucine-rich repeat flightless-interacting protein 1 isoform X9 [Rattus norvegicus]|uniref:leucine-rich repeat flightless-interacting protein 1 isoform X9 n=1 Tax=Rattus norvegicus TaxID=10116 RepID=UPI0003D0EAE6|nr:leucine-rich repeat flightless-interacting protein 1 isoform X9 [Rattus norvegicus]|eukprot:XP_006245512.1 PREDICTED: leucine-rich repeat flightless-interacting protein 1 isoform X9 [Rattus norvegicus]